MVFEVNLNLDEDHNDYGVTAITSWSKDRIKICSKAWQIQDTFFFFIDCLSVRMDLKFGFGVGAKNYQETE